VFIKRTTRHHQDISIRWIDENLKEAAEQYKFLLTKVPEGVMPRSFTFDTLRTCASDNWTAGFYTGTLLYLYEQTKDKSLYNEAVRKIKLMDNQQHNKGTHDLGFMMYCSYGNLNRIAPDETYKQILINSARALASRFSSKTGCIRSWGKPDDTKSFNVIIDNMMNLELLLWAAKGNRR
jgi:unsaturated chondroitin disaccharide hydrolase